MNKVVFIASFLLFVCCKQKESSAMLQSHEIQLVKPRVIATNQIIDSSVTVQAELRMDGVKIHMTSDGTDPFEKSKVYKQPLEVSEPGMYKFKAYHTEYLESDTETLILLKKGISIDSIIWLSESNAKYSGRGENTLINNTKASINFKNQEWVGFDTIAQAIAIFKEKTLIKTIDVGYLNNPGAWIFPPEQIVVSVSYDGLVFVEKEKLKLPALVELTEQSVETIQLSINEVVKKIKVEVKNVEEIPMWHDGAGNSAWLFMDEWIFN